MSLAATLPSTRPAGIGRLVLRTITTTITVLLCTVAALAIVVAAAIRTSPSGQYVVFGHPVITMLSGSMTPVLRTGDLIVDEPVTTLAQASDLHVGQIITVREAPGSKSFITHRIVAVQDRRGAVSYITKGDDNNSADAAPRPASDVVGVFKTDIPRAGYVLYALHQPRVLGLLLVSLVLWFSIGPLFRFATEKDETAPSA
jgi:signal peptidase I